MLAARATRGVVLVVDDDLDVRDALTTLLEDAGYQPVSVRDGRMALDYLRSHPAPDLILLDMMMPAMGGFELWSALRAERDLHTAPIMVISADRHVGQRWMGSGVEAFITKPIQPDALLKQIENVLNTGATVALSLDRSSERASPSI
jgi:CheY-like chemotaxis protein